MKHETAHEPVAKGNAFAMVLKDRYLLFFALLVLVLNFVTRSGDYVLDRMLLLQAPERAHALGISSEVYIGHSRRRTSSGSTRLAVDAALFGLADCEVRRAESGASAHSGRVVLRVRSRVRLSLITVLFVGRVAESSLDYSLSNTTQQMLWLVTSREAKYKAKQVIDAFVRRAGDTLSAGVVWLSIHFALGTRAFLALNAVIALGWVFFAFVLGKDYEARAAGAEPAPTSAESAREPARLVSSEERRRGTDGALDSSWTHESLSHWLVLSLVLARWPSCGRLRPIAGTPKPWRSRLRSDRAPRWSLQRARRRCWWWQWRIRARYRRTILRLAEGAGAQPPKSDEAPAVTWVVPSEWRSVPNPNGMRIATYQVPPQKPGPRMAI